MIVGYSKLFSDIIHSTVWREEMHVKVVWITMLAMADRHGQVMASIPGLADSAKVTLEQCLDALEIFKSPDEYSRTKDYDGRRIIDVEGGWLILNYEKFRARKDDEEQRQRTKERVRRYRDKANSSLGVDPKDGGFVYLAKITSDKFQAKGMLKIGFSKNPISRLAAEFGVDGVELLAVIPGGLDLEKQVLLRFAEHNSLLFEEYFNDVNEIREYFFVTGKRIVTASNPIAEADTEADTDTKAEKKEEKRAASQPHPALLTPAHEHPAVQIYEEKFSVKVSNAFAKEIVENVHDLGLWTRLISENVARASGTTKDRQRIANWFLKAYFERVEKKENGTTNKSYQDQRADRAKRDRAYIEDLRSSVAERDRKLLSPASGDSE